jgi:hypothetical protein
MEDHQEVLDMIERAVTAIQCRYHPGRTAYLALERLHREIVAARREVDPIPISVRERPRLVS